MHNSLETLPKPLLLKIISYVPNAKKELKLVSKTMYALTSDIFPSEINLTDRASKEQFTEELKGIEYIEAPEGDCFIETIIKYKDPIAYNKSTLRISLHDTGELKETNSDLFDALKENPSFLEKVYVLEISGNQYKKGTKIPFFPNLKKLSLTNTSLIEFEGDENFKDLTEINLKKNTSVSFKILTKLLERTPNLTALNLTESCPLKLPTCISDLPLNHFEYSYNFSTLRVQQHKKISVRLPHLPHLKTVIIDRPVNLKEEHKHLKKISTNFRSTEHFKSTLKLAPNIEHLIFKYSERYNFSDNFFISKEGKILSRIRKLTLEGGFKGNPNMPISSSHAFSSFLKHRTPNLEQITLENLGITHLPENPCLSHLKEISLTNLPFLTGDSFVLFVDAHPTIKTLSARQMNLDDWLGDLIKLKELDILDLSGSELTRESLLKFQKYTEIKKIITEGTKFTEDLSSEDGDE